MELLRTKKFPQHLTHRIALQEGRLVNQGTGLVLTRYDYQHSSYLPDAFLNTAKTSPDPTQTWWLDYNCQLNFLVAGMIN